MRSAPSRSSSRRRRCFSSQTREAFPRRSARKVRSRLSRTRPERDRPPAPQPHLGDPKHDEPRTEILGADRPRDRPLRPRRALRRRAGGLSGRNGLPVQQLGLRPTRHGRGESLGRAVGRVRHQTTPAPARPHHHARRRDLRSRSAPRPRLLAAQVGRIRERLGSEPHAGICRRRPSLDGFGSRHVDAPPPHRAARERLGIPCDDDARDAPEREGRSRTATGSAWTRSAATGGSSMEAGCPDSTAGPRTSRTTTSRSWRSATRTATPRWRSPTRWRASSSASPARRRTCQGASRIQFRTRSTNVRSSSSSMSDTAA